MKKTLGSFIIAAPSTAASCPEPAWALIPPRENFGLRGSKPSCGGGLLPQPTPHQTLPTALTNAANTDLFYQVHGFAMWDFAISTQSCIQTRTWIPPRADSSTLQLDLRHREGFVSVQRHSGSCSVPQHSDGRWVFGHGSALCCSELRETRCSAGG